MAEKHLDPDLSDELAGCLVLVDHLLLHHLQRAYEVCVLLLGWVDSAVFAVSSLFQLCEVIQSHFFVLSVGPGYGLGGLSYLAKWTRLDSKECSTTWLCFISRPFSRFKRNGSCGRLL